MIIKSKENSIIKRTINEFLLIALVILALFTTSVHLKPLTISTTLSPNEQEGWPLPFSSSYDEYDNTESWSYKAQQFDVGAFEENILVFYILIRLIMATVEGVIYWYSSQQYKKLALSTVKHIVVMAVFLFLMYGAYLLRENIINTPREISPIIYQSQIRQQ